MISLNEKPLEAQWNNYVTERNLRLFPCEDYQPSHRESLEKIKDYIRRSIDDFFGKTFELPLSHHYSSDGMSQFQKLIYLIEETGKLLQHDYFATIIYDEYNITDGVQGLYEIIGYYVNWRDTKIKGA
ncbi:MAG: hypothetical protein FWE45_04755 [Firmicutes bacterium]|nr:hypothetical protein [Bacillota bacterium]